MDIAVLKVDCSGLKPVAIGSSADTKVGELAIAMGNPAGADTDGLFRSILSIASQSGPPGPQAALFAALKPFVGPERARQIDQALLVARIAQMATGALRRMSGPPGKGGSTHV